MKFKKTMRYMLFLFPLFIGFMPFLMKRNSSKLKNPYLSKKDERSPAVYNGIWVSTDGSSTLEIANQEAVLTNEKPFLLTFKEITDTQLFFQDQYGYDIIIEENNPNSLKLFDEAEQKEIIFYKEN